MKHLLSIDYLGSEFVTRYAIVALLLIAVLAPITMRWLARRRVYTPGANLVLHDYAAIVLAVVWASALGIPLYLGLDPDDWLFDAGLTVAVCVFLIWYYADSIRAAREQCILRVVVVTDKQAPRLPAPRDPWPNPIQEEPSVWRFTWWNH